MRMQPTAIKTTFMGFVLGRRAITAPLRAKGKSPKPKISLGLGALRIAAFAAPAVRARRSSWPQSAPPRTTKPLLTMHDWEAKHYVLAAVIILVVMGLFAYSWS